MMDLESTARGALNLSITDNLGRTWWCATPLEMGRGRILFPFDNFNNPHEAKDDSGPASLESLRIHCEINRSERGESFTLFSMIPYGSHGLEGPTIAVDAAFDFYKAKSWDAWALELRELGFTAFHLVRGGVRDLSNWKVSSLTEMADYVRKST